MHGQATRLEDATRSLLAQPRRFLGALICTLAVVASAAIAQALMPSAHSPVLPAIYGGLVAFNLLLFFPPGVLTRRPLRLAAALLANILPLPLAPLLYGFSPVLADAALVSAAALSVLARPLGAPLNGFALLVALNLLIPLVLGGAPSLVPLGALAAVVGTICATAADAAAALLLRARAPGFERRLLRMELAGFLADVSHLWRSGRIWPDSRLAARVARVRLLRDEFATEMPGGLPTLPPDAMLEDVGRCARALCAQIDVMSAATKAAVATSLAVLADAARTNQADSARRAVEAMRQAALRRPDPGELDPPARILGLALLLSDLIEAAMPRPDDARGSA